MDFGKAFSFPFQDPDWARKTLIPALISLIPIIGQIYVLGWALGVTRRVIRQDPTPLPELDFGEQLLDGLKATLVSLIYGLPVLIFIVPIILVSNATVSGTNQDIANGLIVLVSVCCSGIILLYALLLAFVLPAAYARMVVSGDIGAAFRFNEVIDLVRSAPGPYLMVFVVSILTGFIAGLGTGLCVVGVALTYTYAMAVNGHMYGQAYNEATGNRSFARVY